MPMNPYKYTGPLDHENDSPVFIQRKDLLSKVVARISECGYYIIFGSRQSGKSTFLRQIANTLKESYHTLYIGIDPAQYPEDNFAPWLIQKFLDGIPHELTGDKKKIKGKSFTYFLRHFKPNFAEKRILLMFDDIENLPNLETFLRTWKFFFESGHEHVGKYSIIFSSSVDLYRLFSESLKYDSSFNFDDHFYLIDFPDRDSRQIIERPFKELNIAIDEEGIQKLVALTAGHPQLLQNICHHLVRLIKEKRSDSISKKDIDEVLEQILRTNSLLKILEQDVKNDEKLRSLIISILNGEKKKYFPYQNFSFEGVGPIREKDDFCIIRNKVYEIFLRRILSGGEDVLISQSSENEFLYAQENNLMPCALKRLRVDDFHGIVNTDIRLPVDARWIFLTGENAFGKTAILKALTIGLFGSRDEDRVLIEPGSSNRIAVELKLNGENRINNVGAYDFKPFTRFAAYGTSRLFIQSDRTLNDMIGKSTKTYSLFNNDGVALNIERELILWYLDNDHRFETAKNILLELMPHGADIVVDRKNKDVLYIEKESGDDGNETFEPIRFDKLSAGNKSIIAIIGDLLIRFYNEYQSENTRPSDFEGMVIIDELDVHLHPRWLRQMPGILSRLFPKIQFIVSTHSEISLLGAPKHSVFLKVTRTREKGIQIHRLPIDIKNLLSHHILTSPIFDLEDGCVQAANGNIEDVRTESSYSQVMETDKITADLKTFDSGEQDLPDHVLDLDND